ncbi:MAG: sigma-70 family RNA polymerase sigma factor [Elusimicrobia bacterium]|nr:sigma-70 family RNA polymerase sigma factor [Elusimicrobiota bacterium]
MTSEHELIALSRGGDPRAFTTLLSRYEDRIRRLIRRASVGISSEIDDIYQDTVLAAYTKLRFFREECELGTWLYRIASNQCLMRRRKKSREIFVLLLDRPHADEDSPARQFRDGEPTPEEAATRNELFRKVTGAFSKLPRKYRLVLTLRDVEGLSGGETANVLKLSRAAMKSRLHRGRLRLRNAFERPSGENEALVAQAADVARQERRRPPHASRSFAFRSQSIHAASMVARGHGR